MASRRKADLLEPGEISSDGIDRRSTTRHLASLAVSAACGFVFGFAIEKGKVHEPFVVKNQMLLSQFVMMKMFLSGVISGMFLLSVMSMLPFTRQQYLCAKSAFVRGLKGKGFLAVCVGGALLGSGMAIAGSCPGVVLAQVGSGTQNSVYTLLGALFGTLLYGILEPVVTDLTKPEQAIRYQFLYNVYGSPFFVMALPTAAILSLVVFTLELAYPWEEEISITDSVYESSSWIASPAWPPYLSGVVVGTLQIPLVLFVGDTLGASSSFCTITSQVFLHKSSKRLSPYLLKFQTGFSNWWQVTFMSGSVFGAFSSSILSGSYGTVTGGSVTQSFVGGAMIIFGARLAGGCTSGHGLSGMGLLNLLSISTMAAMFVGGALTAQILQWIG
ncbi:thiosulfate transporter TsuA-like [Saccostrea cucullata]|uniref:thiosulfate transporter TsuA-like n=1 Tax=Saccostrea cuccullata TaxID=36930 RepID=UPI002ED1B555